MYVVTILEEKRELYIPGTTTNISLSWADGMIGVMPVFKTKKTAEKYISGIKPKPDIHKITEKK